MSTGVKISEARTRKNMSQAALARAAGVNQAQISRYEKGDTKDIPYETLKKIASALDVPMSYFHEGADTGERTPLGALIDELLQPPFNALTEKQALALIEFFREFKREKVATPVAKGTLADLTLKQKEDAIRKTSGIMEEKISRLPVLDVQEKAAAGAPEYVETPPEPLLLAQHRWKKGFRPFKITGNSMEPYIMNGDYVVVDLMRPPVNGDTVLARVDDGLVVKKFYKEKGRVELESINPEYAPIAGRDISILGVLIDIVRPVKKV